MYLCGNGETQFDEEQYCCLTNNQRVLPQMQKNYESTMPTQRIPNEKEILFSDFLSSKKNRQQVSLRQKVSLSKVSDKNRSKNRVQPIENVPSTDTHKNRPFQLTPRTPTPYYTQPIRKQQPPIAISSYGITPKTKWQHEKIYTNKVYFNAANINNKPNYIDRRENIKKFIDEYKESAMNAPRNAPKRFAFESPDQFKQKQIPVKNRVTIQQIRETQNNKEENCQKKESFCKKQSKSCSVSKNQEEKSQFREMQEQEKLRKSSKVSLNREKMIESSRHRQQTQNRHQESKQSLNNSAVSNIFESSPRLEKKVHTAMSIYDESMVSSQQAFMTRKSNNLENMFSPLKNKGKEKMEESIVVMDFFNPPNKIRELIEEDLKNRKL